MQIIILERTQNAKPLNIPLNDYVLRSPHVIKFVGSVKDISSVERKGFDLIVTLTSGKKITLYNFYKENDVGNHSELVVDDGSSNILWLNENQNFVPISENSPLLSGFAAAGEEDSGFSPILLLGGLLGAGAIAGIASSNKSDGSSSWFDDGTNGWWNGWGNSTNTGGNTGGNDGEDTDDDGNTGTPRDIIPPAMPTDLVLNPEGTQLTGKGESGSTVIVTDKDGTEIGRGQVGDDGNFSIDIQPPLTDGNVGTVIAQDDAGNVSPPQTVIGMKDTIPPAMPTNLDLDNDGVILKGKGEPGSTIIVTDKDGKEIGRDAVKGDGTFIVTIAGSDAVTDGNVVTVVAQDAAGNISPPGSATGWKDTIPPAMPTDLVLNADGIELKGEAEPGATIIVTNQNGDEIGRGTVNGDGTFTINIDAQYAVTDGNEVTVAAQDAAGNISPPGTATGLKDTIPPAMPTDLVLDADGVILNGEAEPNATIIVTNQNGDEIGRGTVNGDGTFTIDIDEQYAVTDGNEVTVVAQDAANNVSPPGTATGLKDTIPPDAPIASWNVNSETVTITTEPNAIIKFYEFYESETNNRPLLNSAGEAITVTADASGHASYTFDRKLSDNEVISLTATDASANVSSKTDLTINYNEIIAASDNHVEIILDGIPQTTTNPTPENLNTSGTIVAKVGLGAVLGANVLDIVGKSVQMNVGNNEIRNITVQGKTSGIQILATMDLYLYKMNEVTGQWEQHSVQNNWIVSDLLTGASSNTDFSLTEGRWLFVLGSADGIQALTQYDLEFTKDIVSDYNSVVGVSGSATGNIITDDDPVYGVDVVPIGTTVTMVNGTVLVTTGDTTIVGTYGTLTISADGAYSYTVNPAVTGYGMQDVFEYTITSPSGETSSAELKFDLNVIPSSGGSDATVDNTVDVTVSPSITYDGLSSIPVAKNFGVLTAGVLNPILDVNLLNNIKAMSFDVSANQVKELTFNGDATKSLIGLATTYDLYIYKLDPDTGKYKQVVAQAEWFKLGLGLLGIVIGGKSDPLTLQFGEGSYKVFLQSAGGVNALLGTELSVTKEKIYDYDKPATLNGSTTGDATDDPALVILAVNGQSIEAGKQLTINGEYGRLVIAEDGTYTYTVSKPANDPTWKPPYGEIDHFQLVTKDANGKTAIDSLNIQIGEPNYDPTSNPQPFSLLDNIDEQNDQDDSLNAMMFTDNDDQFSGEDIDLSNVETLSQEPGNDEMEPLSLAMEDVIFTNEEENVTFSFETEELSSQLIDTNPEVSMLAMMAFDPQSMIDPLDDLLDQKHY